MREWSDSIYVANNKIDGVKLAHVCRETTSVHKRGGGDEAISAMFGTESGIVLSAKPRRLQNMGR